MATPESIIPFIDIQGVSISRDIEGNPVSKQAGKDMRYSAVYPSGELSQAAAEGIKTMQNSG